LKNNQSDFGRRYLFHGIVQGVGFRPTVYRIAHELGLVGSVYNDYSGAVADIWGSTQDHSMFSDRLQSNLPHAAKIESIKIQTLKGSPPIGFSIKKSTQDGVPTNVVPDLGVCSECITEISIQNENRYQYPFTNCTNCGPRYSIIHEMPYDRIRTSMSEFSMCEKCSLEYENPKDRRFHAQPIACNECGPKIWFETNSDQKINSEEMTDYDHLKIAAEYIKQGEILAIKGIGGYHLACDATQSKTLKQLRERKNRPKKPFALMAKNLEMIQRFCEFTSEEQEWLESPVAPIVLLKKINFCSLPNLLAPGQNSLGFMLPYTPLHHLLFNLLEVPLVMTSGNLSDEPQCINEEQVRQRLSGITKLIVMHNREIINRIDDSIVRKSYKGRQVIRRARGLAPNHVLLPKGFEGVSNVLACGSELKNTFCMLHQGSGLLSPHIGDLKDNRVEKDYKKCIDTFEQFYLASPEIIAVDLHPDYRSVRFGEDRSEENGLTLFRIQHHHAHIASCLGEHKIPLRSPPVLGVALDGFGMGTDGTFWGGEFMMADYLGFERIGTFKPIPLLGGNQAMREPWRNLLAHIFSGMGWDYFQKNYSSLKFVEFLREKPIKVFEALMAPERSPSSSSCGRLFDAVAAALGVCRETISYEGEAAMLVEALAHQDSQDSKAYPFDISKNEHGIDWIEPGPFWEKLFGDLIEGIPLNVVAGRFHRGLAKTIVRMVKSLCRPDGKPPKTNTIALSGGVFQNTMLLNLVWSELETNEFKVLTNAEIPANDGGISLGQALIASAKHLNPKSK
jgi:hydrogenase maturation protein HypF|tara:strand:+ start:4093 stop:6462 length:2370 start_codon:yes stop_codon:yes gene_type:complete